MSPHSFVDPYVAKQLRLQEQPTAVSLKVLVANGESMYCNKECPLFSWKMQDEVFSFNIKL